MLSTPLNSLVGPIGLCVRAYQTALHVGLSSALLHSNMGIPMSIYNELQGLNAPSKVLQAGQEIDKNVQAGIPPSREFVAYVRDWVTRNQGNNRYGK